MSKYYRAQGKALEFSRTVDLNQFSQEDLCSIYAELNRRIWDVRLGSPPKAYGSRYGFCYSIAVMDRIADKVGEKAVAKWRHMHYLGRSEQEFEEWYERRLQEAALRQRW